MDIEEKTFTLKSYDCEIPKNGDDLDDPEYGTLSIDALIENTGEVMRNLEYFEAEEINDFAHRKHVEHVQKMLEDLPDKAVIKVRNYIVLLHDLWDPDWIKLSHSERKDITRHRKQH